MPLKSFGVVLTFAEKIEEENKEFYGASLTKLPEGETKAFFEQCIKDKEKQIKLIQRVRRENVAEMILEPIADFTRDAFLIDAGQIDASSPDEIVKAARQLEDRNFRYYEAAAEKIKALPEVATALENLAKKEKKLLKKIDDL